jgi:hypothetical protein
MGIKTFAGLSCGWRKKGSLKSIVVEEEAMKKAEEGEGTKRTS